MSILSIFVSYSREDKRWVDKDYDKNLIPWLSKHLRKDEVDIWYDHALKDLPGVEYEKVIISEINAARMAILLLSEDFAASDFISKTELPRIKERFDLNELLIIPILVRKLDFDYDNNVHLKWICDTQIIPGDPTPLIKYAGDDGAFDEVRSDILRAIRNKVRELRETHPVGDGIGMAELTAKYNDFMGKISKMPCWHN